MVDIVEALREVQEEFGVSLRGRRAERINTVGDLYLVVLGKTRAGAGVPCATSRAFYRLRRALVGEVGLDRARIRPSSRLCDLFPPKSRNATWPRVAGSLDLPDLPALPERVGSARPFVISVAVVMACWSIVYSIFLAAPGGKWPTTTAVAFGLLVWFLLMLLVCGFFGARWIERSREYRERIRAPQVRHLVIRLVLQSPAASASPGPGEATPLSVWTRLVEILALNWGVPAHEIRPEHRFWDLHEILPRSRSGRADV